jgi:hypothetical protein
MKDLEALGLDDRVVEEVLAGALSRREDIPLWIGALDR